MTAIHSVAALLPLSGGLVTTPPFRVPHHTASDVALASGGAIPGRSPAGEISLGHNGVLLRDEAAEFVLHVLDVLRQPPKTTSCRWPAPPARWSSPPTSCSRPPRTPACGYIGEPTRPCRCSPQQVARYRSRLSGIPARPHRPRRPRSRGGVPGDHGGRLRRSVGPVRRRVAAARGIQRGRNRFGRRRAVERAPCRAAPSPAAAPWTTPGCGSSTRRAAGSISAPAAARLMKVAGPSPTSPARNASRPGTSPKPCSSGWGNDERRADGPIASACRYTGTT